MIEALVSYIEEKGFHVDIAPSMLLIWKMAEGKRAVCSWMISQTEIKYLVDWRVLLLEADLKMGQITKLIEEGSRD